jgi:hypothetical protein
VHKRKIAAEIRAAERNIPATKRRTVAGTR